MHPSRGRASGPQSGAELGVPPGASGSGSSQRLWSLESLRSFQRAVRATLAGVPRVMGLVWETHRGLTLGLALMTLLQSVVPAIQVYLSKLLIDAVVNAVRAGGSGPYVRAVVVLAVLQLVAGAGSSLMQTLANIWQQLLQERVAIRVQTMLMEHANWLDLAHFESPKFYDTLQQAQQQSAFRPVQMVSSTFSLVRSIITFLSMVALLLRLGWVIALIALVSPIPSFVATSRYGWWGFQLMRRQSPARRLMNYLTTVLTTDTFNKEVKIFGVGPFFVERYKRLAQQYYEENRRLLVRRYLMSFAWGSLTTLATSATYLYVALLAVAGRVTLGDLTLFLQAATSVQQNFQGVLTGLQGVYEHNLYLDTIFELLETEPAIRPPEQPVPVAAVFTEGVEFRKVTYRYPNSDKMALSGVSFSIGPGETVALVGRNGAGKTTIVKLLARLYDPDEGQVLIDGHDVREYDPTELRSKLSVIFQDYATYQLTARENIGVGQTGRMEDSEAVATAARSGGADEVIEALPEGYDTVLGKWFDGGYQLSGGEWQKVALSRAFMRDAQILILDEPTSALDAQAEYDLFARMARLTEGKTAMFISHRFSTVRMANKIIVLEHGAVIEQGTDEELMLRGGRYAELFELQAASYR
ncbi:MAG: ABC transporter ATP-binding protein/permease [Chloroflexota bacterium]|nr:ABC transporter ATP-binding protein/permease [Chloroflexota bacterium]